MTVRMPKVSKLMEAEDLAMRRKFTGAVARYI